MGQVANTVMANEGKMSAYDDLALRPVIDHHLREAIRLMKATGEGADPSVWDELRIYMPPATAGRASATREVE